MNAWQRDRDTPWNIAAPSSELALLGRVMTHEGITDLAGSARPTLIGVRRMNWAVSTRQFVLFEQHAPNLAEVSPIMLLKGAALRLIGKSPYERGHSDIDIAVPLAKVRSVLNLLESSKFLPSHGTDFGEISHRLLERRDGWNFEHPSGLNLDLHWRIFEHRGRTSDVDPLVWMRATSHELPTSHTEVLVPDSSSLGVYSLYHAFVRGTARDRLQHLLDLADLVTQENIHPMFDLACDLGLRDVFVDRINILEQLGVRISLSNSNFQPSHRKLPPVEPWLQRRRPSPRRDWRLAFARSRKRPWAEVIETHLLRRPMAYGVWGALGYLSSLERVLIHRKPMTMSVTHDQSKSKREYHLAELEDRNEILGPGWSWRVIDEDFVWSDRLESRLVIPINCSTRGHLLIEFSPIALSPPRMDGRFSCLPTGDIYTNGVLRASYDFTMNRQLLLVKIPYALSKNQKILEVSFRPTALVSHRNLGPVYQSWKQSVPLKSVSLFVDDYSSDGSNVPTSTAVKSLHKN